MPCHVPAARVSSRRHRLISSSPPLAFLAVLNLDKPVERQACDYVRRATRGKRPLWRLLGLGKTGSRLRCAVRWAQQITAGPFSLVELDLADPSGLALSWRDFATAAAAVDALRAMPPCNNPSAEGGR